MTIDDLSTKAVLLVATLLGAPGLQFTSSVQLVEVYATVADRQGRPVAGLPADAFEVYEQDQPQTVTVFTAGEMGLSVAVALDRSFSMSGERLTAMTRATEQFLDALRPADRAMLIGIGSRVEVLAPLPPDAAGGRTADAATGRADGRDAARRALRTLDAFGSTSLHDAIITALDEIQPASGRRALVLLSDGIDRYSKAAESDVLERARRGDVLVYPITVGKIRSEKTRPRLFAELAAATGGRSAHVTDLRQLPEVLTTIAEELRQQYLLGYTPQRPSSKAPEWRSLRVVVRRPDVTVRARPGYWTR